MWWTIFNLHLVSMNAAVAIFRITKAPVLDTRIVEHQVGVHLKLKDKIAVLFDRTQKSIVLPWYCRGNDHSILHLNFVFGVEHFPTCEIFPVEHRLPVGLLCN